ncbi:MAG TPA: hypothetical protein VMK65_06555 [Longimicrobiales bacterium]|nr:hypothetical protein [Longimicrobiales bacterium]
MKRIFGFAAGLSASLVALGCGDDLGSQDWEARVDTVALYSLARPELQGLPSALDFVASGGRTVVVEALGATGNWDIALTEGASGFVLLPAGAVQGAAESTAGIGVVRDRTFEELQRASSDSAFFVQDAAVPLEPSAVYVVRSHQNPNFSSCFYYAKVELVDTDATEGRARLRYTRNPRCNDRALIPPGGD